MPVLEFTLNKNPVVSLRVENKLKIIVNNNRRNILRIEIFYKTHTLFLIFQIPSNTYGFWECIMEMRETLSVRSL